VEPVKVPTSAAVAPLPEIVTTGAAVSVKVNVPVDPKVTVIPSPAPSHALAVPEATSEAAVQATGAQLKGVKLGGPAAPPGWANWTELDVQVMTLAPATSMRAAEAVADAPTARPKTKRTFRISFPPY
jgi:hypothetical protein